MVTVTKVAAVVMSRPQAIVVRYHEVHVIVQNQKCGIDPNPGPGPGHMNPEKTNERNIHSINGDGTVAKEVVRDIVEVVIGAENGVENEIDVHRLESTAVVNQMNDDVHTMISRKN